MTEPCSKALLYDQEKNHTTTAFVDALKTFLQPRVQFIAYLEAKDDEKQSLPCVAVVRSTTIRYKEDIDLVIQELSDNGGIDLQRVVIIYFYMNQTDDTKEPIKGNYPSFKSIAEMDFRGNTFYRRNIHRMNWSLSIKDINNRAKTDIITSLESIEQEIQMKKKLEYKAMIYYAERTSVILDLLEHIKQGLPVMTATKTVDIPCLRDAVAGTPLVVIRQIKEAGECDQDVFKELSDKHGIIYLNVIEAVRTSKENVVLGQHINEKEKQPLAQADISQSGQALKNDDDTDSKGHSETSKYNRGDTDAGTVPKPPPKVMPSGETVSAETNTNNQVKQEPPLDQADSSQSGKVPGKDDDNDLKGHNGRNNHGDNEAEVTVNVPKPNPRDKPSDEEVLSKTNVNKQDHADSSQSGHAPPLKSYNIFSFEGDVYVSTKLIKYIEKFLEECYNTNR